MTAIREADLRGALSKGQHTLVGALFHARDVSSVVAITRKTVETIRTLGTSPLLSARLSLADVKSDPARLIDMFDSISLLGERSITIVDGADDSLLPAVEPLLTRRPNGNFLILQAGALAKSSRLRLAFEGAKSVLSMALYDAEEGELRLGLRRSLEGGGKTCAAGVEDLFISLVGTDRGNIASETEKLLVYVGDRPEVSLDDVERLCGDSGGFSIDDLIDAVLEGDLSEIERLLASSDSTESTAMTMLQLHLERLLALSLELGDGLSAEAAVRRAKPQIFFKRVPAFIRQLTRLDAETIEHLLIIIAAASFATRGSAAPSAGLHRALLQIAAQRPYRPTT